MKYTISCIANLILFIRNIILTKKFHITLKYVLLVESMNLMRYIYLFLVLVVTAKCSRNPNSNLHFYTKNATLKYIQLIQPVGLQNNSLNTIIPKTDYFSHLVVVFLFSCLPHWCDIVMIWRRNYLFIQA